MLILAIIFSYILVITSVLPGNGEEKVTFEEIGLFLSNIFDNLGLESLQEDEIIYKLGRFRVNLTQVKVDRLLLAEVNLSLKKQNVIEHLKKREPQIKDTVITILRQSNYDEKGNLNIDFLKKEIKNEINQIIGEQSVKNVWFSELIIR